MKRILQFNQNFNQPYAFTFLSWLLITIALLCYNTSNAEILNFNTSAFTCDNVTHGGAIGGYELGCGSFDPAIITNVESPSGGWGAIEYLWMKSTDPSLPWEEWTPISGANSSTYNPSTITQTTYFLRCSRRDDCSYWAGESNIVAKIVANVDTNCAGTLTTNTGFVKSVTQNGGTSYEGNILGTPNGTVAKLYDEDDYLIVELDDLLKAGDEFIVSWKTRDYTSSFGGPAKLQLFVSANGTDFDYLTTLTTSNKKIIINDYVTVSQDVKYIKLYNGWGSPDFAVDAISYCQSDCQTICENVTNGGQIGNSEVSNGSFDPALIENLAAPSGGTGTIEYLWLATTDFNLPASQWDTLLVGPTAGPTFDPSIITQTTYYLRCSRRQPCELYEGESNIIAKVVINTDGFVCQLGAPTGFTAGNASTIFDNNGVGSADNALNALNGSLAQLYDDNDYITIDLGETLLAGETYAISWKGRDVGFTANPVKINILESTNGIDFTLNTSLETFVKDFVISQNITAQTDVRYIKIEQANGFAKSEVDAISYFKAQCPVCDNVTDGGQIGSSEVSNGSFDPAVIQSLVAPSGGTGTIEYLWLATTDFNLPASQWDTLLVGPAAGPTYDPGTITQTTYYLRCSRRQPCELFEGESNIIAKVVINTDGFVCQQGAPTGFTAGNASSIFDNNGVDAADNALNALNGNLAQLYDDNDYITIDLGETLSAGETYAISWKGRDVGFTANPVKINILESTDGTDFTLNTSLETFVKDFVISQNITAQRDVRYIKIEQASGFAKSELDAISYFKAQCPDCATTPLVTWDLDACNAISGSTNLNFNEFVPSYPNTGNCAAVTASNVTRNNPTTNSHSCTPGYDGNPAMCVSSRKYCSFSNNHSKAVRFEVTITPDASGKATLSGLDFYEKAPTYFDWINGASGLNSPPSKYGLRVTVDGQEVFKQVDIATTNEWTLESFDFSDDADFEVTEATTFKFELLGYCVSGNTSVRAWDLDQIQIYGCCAENIPDVCDNVTDGGTIEGTEVSSGSFDPALIGSVALPSGGNGPIEYLWLATTDFNLPAAQWDTLLSGPTAGPTYNPGTITQTTYYLRCSRRLPCELYEGESNIIAKVVVDETLPCGGGVKTPGVLGTADNIDDNSGVDAANKALNGIDGEVAELYEDNDYITLDLGVTLQAGETYVISYKGRDVGFTANPVKIEILESEDGTDFTAAATLETFVKDFIVNQSIVASRDVRYIKIQQAAGFAKSEVDAITYSKATCTLPTVCELNDHGKADQSNEDRAVWMRFAINDEIKEYTVISDAKFTQFPNGTALLTGIVANIEEDCEQWLFSVKLVNKSDWNTWSNILGRSYKQNNNIAVDNHEDWFYYELDENNSSFTGLGCNAGNQLALTHKPSDFEFGFQLGDGANLKNGDYGLSGWFDFAGSLGGRGDFNANIDNCVEQSTLVNIGDFVWEDLNGNGLQDADEPGIENVKVQLIGTDYNGNGVDITVYTDKDGLYKFSNLQPGTYKVIFSELPGAYFTTKEKEGVDQSIDSDVDPISGMSDVQVYGGGENDLDVDAGYIRYAAIGDFVWEDLNGNGIKDFNEPGIGGVPVNLSGQDGTGEPVNRNTNTNPQGLYFFDGLRPGTYKLTFSPAAGLQPTFKSAGTDKTLDSDINPNNMTDDFTLISGEINGNLDAGYYTPINISGRVFDDKDDNGLQNVGDLDVADVNVELLRKNADGEFETYDTDTSLENGSFGFNNLPPGEYKISTDENSLPLDYTFSKIQDIDGNTKDDIDNDANEIGMINGIVLTSGQGDINDLGIGVLFNIILPVELVDFNAKVINNNQVLLTWITESELDNKLFEIERSIDGSNFEIIGTVTGAGTSSQVNTYYYNDEAPFFGRNYYRLKQIDFDGKYDFSDIKSVVVKGNDLPDAIFYPNPTKDITNLRVVSPFEADATVEIVNVSGQLLKTIIVPQGKNSVEIDLSDYQPGFYFMTVKYNEYRKIVHRVLKVQD